MTWLFINKRWVWLVSTLFIGCCSGFCDLIVTSNKVFDIMHTLNLKVDEVKQLFGYASSRLSNPRIQNRSPWPPRPYDPSAHGGIRSGLSFPPCSALCGVDAWFLSPVWRSECGSQKADPNPQRQGPLPVCCLCRFAPWSVLSVGGENVFHYRGGNMNGSFVGLSSCWFGQVYESPQHDHHHFIPQ